MPQSPLAREQNGWEDGILITATLASHGRECRKINLGLIVSRCPVMQPEQQFKRYSWQALCILLAPVSLHPVQLVAGV